MTAATPQPPPASDLECKVCEHVSSPHGAAWAGSGFTAPEGGVTAGQAAYELFRTLWPVEDWGTWEYIGETDAEHHPGWEAIAQAAIAAQDARPAQPTAEGADAYKKHLDQVFAPAQGEVERLRAALAESPGQAWERRTQAAGTAPELAAAMAETREVRDGYAKLCEAFSDSLQSGQSARVSLTVLNRHRELAGLAKRRPAPAGERRDPFMQMHEQLAAVAAIATEMHAQAQMIAPASSEPDGMPDIADQARAMALREYAARIRQALGPDAS